MKYSHATVGRMQLDDYVRLVPRIYGVHDQHRSMWDVWCHTLHHGANVAERLRKGAPAATLFTEIADLAVWLFTIVNKLSGKPGKRKTASESPVETLIRIQNTCSDIVWHRYPGVCHLCYARRTVARRRGNIYAPCDCSARGWDSGGKDAKRADQRALRIFSQSAHDRKPKTIDDWQAMFAVIFAKKIESLSPTEIGFHLLEELGEVSNAMTRMYSYTESNFRAGEPNFRQARLEDQIADAFSWLFTLVQKLSEVKPRFATKKIGIEEADLTTLSSIIWGRYGSENLQAFYCPCCNNAVCSCPLVFVPGTYPINDLLRNTNHQNS